MIDTNFGNVLDNNSNLEFREVFFYKIFCKTNASIILFSLLLTCSTLPFPIISSKKYAFKNNLSNR